MIDLNRSVDGLIMQKTLVPSTKSSLPTTRVGVAMMRFGWYKYFAQQTARHGPHTTEQTANCGRDGKELPIFQSCEHLTDLGSKQPSVQNIVPHRAAIPQ